MTPHDEAQDELLLPLGIKGTLLKLFVDVYVGKDSDNPPITQRLDRIERSLALLYKVLVTGTVMSATALLATIGQIVVKVIH